MEISHITKEKVICKDFQRKRECLKSRSSKLTIPRKANYEKRTFFLPIKHTCQRKAEDFSYSVKIRTEPEQFLSLIAGFVQVKDPSICSHVPPPNQQQQDCAKVVLLFCCSPYFCV